MTNSEQEKLKADLEKVMHSDLSSEAVAMADRISKAIDIEVISPEIRSELKKDLAIIVKGRVQGHKFDVQSFGTRPIDFAIKTVFDEAEHRGYTIDKKEREKLEADIFRNIMQPAFDKYLSVYKLLTLLPGSPTEFAGDRVGATGYETKCKNFHQQNRNILKWEYLDETKDGVGDYQFVRNFNDKINEISGLRSKKELSALNDGASVVLPVLSKIEGAKPNDEGKLPADFSENFQAMLRYDDKGSVVLTLFNNVGANVDVEKEMNRPKDNDKRAMLKQELGQDTIFDSVLLNAENIDIKGFQHEAGIVENKLGLKHGIDTNMIFKDSKILDNPDLDDGSYYKFVNESYNLGQDKNGKNRNGNYYILKHFTVKNGFEVEIPIRITDKDLNALVLYRPI